MRRHSSPWMRTRLCKAVYGFPMRSSLQVGKPSRRGREVQHIYAPPRLAVRAWHCLLITIMMGRDQAKCLSTLVECSSEEPTSGRTLLDFLLSVVITMLPGSHSLLTQRAPHEKITDASNNLPGTIHD